MGTKTLSLDEIFRAAIEISAADDRAAYLQRACLEDTILREHVELLLAAHFRGASYMKSSPPGQAAGGDEPIRDFPGSMIGSYKLLEQIGEGGFGVVFMAEQSQPVRRKVALKVVKPGMDSRQVVARFEAERQALALMDHPNIAQVYDGGETESGRPYFVMELVRGLPITDYCDQASLTPRERLELFVVVCHAVQHAHQKGIIHRDIKPSNVLVSLHDGKPVVKIIDFGIAKALGQQLTDKTLFTGFAQLIGTPLYMSPEQAALSGLDVDTRTDIYSLGVLLYELLTGTTPFARERFQEASYDEIRRVIREEDPPKPSTRGSTLGELSVTVSARRKSDSKQLSQLFRRELDWIVMKALEKDRNRRYETASAFAADVQRYLNDETVQACPPSAGYKLRKFVRRNKASALAAAVVLLALVGSVVVSSTSAVMFWREKKLKQVEQFKAAANAKAAVEVVHRLFPYVESYEMSSGNAAASYQQRMERLDAALASYERLLRLQPEDPTLRYNVALMHRMSANLNRFLDKTAEAESSYREAIRRFNQLAADYPEAPAYREQAALTLRDFGVHLQKLGRYQEAAHTLDDSIRLFEELQRTNPDESNNWRLLAFMLVDRSVGALEMGKLAESEQASRKAAELFAKLADTPGTRAELFDPHWHAAAEHNQAIALREQGRIDEAVAAHNSAVDRMAELIKITNSRDAWSFYHRTRTERAWTLARVPGRAAGAIADLESAIAGWDKLIKQWGENPIDQHRKGVASFYCGQIKRLTGERDAAARDLSVAARILERLTDKQSEIPVYRYDLGRIYMAIGQVADDRTEAANWYRKGREMLEAAVQRSPENAEYRQALKELDALTAVKP